MSGPSRVVDRVASTSSGHWEFSVSGLLPISHSFPMPQVLVLLSALQGPGPSCSRGSTRGPGLSSPQASGEDSVRARGPEQGCRALPG